MIVAVCAVLAIVVLTLTVAVVRLRRRIDVAAAAEEERTAQLRTVEDDLTAAERRVDELRDELDRAIDRAQVSEADAATTAERLSELADRHETVVSEHAALVAEHARLADERDALAQRSVDAGSTVDGEIVWALTLARLDRMWRVSVASATDTTSPLLSSQNLLEDALEVVVAAAREEAGAIVSVDYTGTADIEGSTAATVVALVEEFVAAAVTSADEARFDVSAQRDAVYVAVHAIAGDSRVQLPGPVSLRGVDGRYRIERAASTG